MFQLQRGTLFFAHKGTFGLQEPLGSIRVGLATFGLSSIRPNACGGRDRTGGLLIVHVRTELEKIRILTMTARNRSGQKKLPPGMDSFHGFSVDALHG